MTVSLLSFSSLTEINKGWSGDKKYRAVDKNGNKWYFTLIDNR